MKKRLPAIALALALCLGLAIPVFASSETASGAPTIRVNLALPDGSTPQFSTSDCQLRGASSFKSTIKDNTSGASIGTFYVISRADEPTSYELTACTLPLGTTITISNLRNSWDNKDRQVDVVAVEAYSDPDGDGVYDQWIYDFTKNPPVAPFAEDKIAYSASENGRYGSTNFLTKDNTLEFDLQTLPDTVTVTTDYLSEMFGPNTLIVFDVQIWTALNDDGSTALPTGSSGSVCCFLTGKKAADAPSTPAFTDVPDWCADAVDWAAQNKVTEGYPDGRFGTNDPCTEAQILTLLWRAAGSPAEGVKTPITGLEEGSPYYAAAQWASDKGMIDPGTFDPGKSCTRAQAMTYICQAFAVPYDEGEAAKAADRFSDVDGGAPYAYAVAWAVENGIAEGYPDGTFGPDTVCNRGVIATLLYRAYVEEARLK